MTKRLGRILTGKEHYAADHATVARGENDYCNARKVSTLQVRRVIPSGGSEELQIEISIETFHKRSGRCTSMLASLCLSPADADALAKACAELRKPGAAS